MPFRVTINTFSMVCVCYHWPNTRILGAFYDNSSTGGAIWQWCVEHECVGNAAKLIRIKKQKKKKREKSLRSCATLKNCNPVSSETVVSGTTDHYFEQYTSVNSHKCNFAHIQPSLPLASPIIFRTQSLLVSQTAVGIFLTVHFQCWLSIYAALLVLVLASTFFGVGHSWCSSFLFTNDGLVT